MVTTIKPKSADGYSKARKKTINLQNVLQSKNDGTLASDKTLLATEKASSGNYLQNMPTKPKLFNFSIKDKV